MALTAVVLAGGPADDVSALQTGAPNKTFVRVGGVALVERTLGALRASERVGRIIVVAPASAHDDPALALADERRPDGARIAESLRSGLGGLPSDEPVLLTTADLPVLDAAAIDDFIARSLSRDLDAAYAIVERRVHTARYPQIPHTWARMQDGTFCGGGVFALRPRVLPSLDRFLADLARARKAPLRLASVFGWNTLLQFAFGQLTIGAAERRASALLGAPAGAIISAYPQIAVNVDRATDIALAEALF